MSECKQVNIEKSVVVKMVVAAVMNAVIKLLLMFKALMNPP